ncbi:MAG: chemotaxis-specific protein-glutamate methyltransferase CheB [Kofleriaceae bacterium]
MRPSTIEPIRVLLVDDSVVVRKVLSKIVASDPELAVAGIAASASIGLQKLEHAAPDVVVLDVEMEEMNGIEMAAEVRRRWPWLPILMCSALTERGADAALRALAAGASDYIAKPRFTGETTGLGGFRDELIEKLKTLARASRARGAAPKLDRTARLPVSSTAITAVIPTTLEAPRPPPAVILLGCSTGGPNALSEIFAGLRGAPAVPLLIVQHMPPLFTRTLADRLTRTTGIPTTEASHGAVIQPGHAYIAPGDFHMTVVRRGRDVELALDQEPPESSCRPAIDPLFRSAAAVYGSRVLAGVLTGMGRDGSLGARQVVEAGGKVFVQSAGSCVVPSMPTAVLDAGVPADVIPLARIGSYLSASATQLRSAS